MNIVNTQIRILYNIFISIFMFIIGILITSIYKISISYNIALVFIVQLIVLQMIYKKTCLKNGDTKKKILITLGVSILLAPIIYFLSSVNIYIVVGYNLFFILSLVLTRSFYWDIYEYSQYIVMFKAYIIVEFIVLLVLKIFSKTSMYNYTILLMISLLISVIILRQSRNQENGIVSKFDKKFNMAIIAISMFSLTKCFQDMCKFIVGLLYKGMESIFDVVMKVLIWILTPIINFLERHIGISNKTIKYDIVIKETTDEKDKIDKIRSIARQENFKKIWDRIIMILTILTIIAGVLLIGILIYNVIKKVKERKNVNQSKEYYEIEKLEPESKRKSKKIAKLVGDSNAINIRRTYIEFLKFSKKKEIYRPNMTPTALSNAMKTKVDAFDELDNIKDIYNETKFSNHDITSSKVTEIKESYKNTIKKDRKIK